MADNVVHLRPDPSVPETAGDALMHIGYEIDPDAEPAVIIHWAYGLIANLRRRGFEIVPL